MHVLQLGPYPPPEGGIHRNMLAIRDELLAHGHQCSIIATAKSSKITPEKDVYHPRTAAELFKLLFSLKYDILHLHIGGTISLRVLGLLFACGIFGRKKSILTLHSGGFAVSDEAKNAKFFSKLGTVFRLFTKIICVNTLLMEVFERFGVSKNKIRLIYPFVHKIPDANVEIPAKLKTFAENHSPFLLTVGLLEDTYDLFMQIDALEKVLQKLPNAGLMIVGSGSLEVKLKTAIASKSYADNIFLANDVEHQITLHLIDKCDVLLRTTKFDGDAISVREALFLDKHVIATDNKMRPEGVHLMPIHDENALVESIKKLANSAKRTRSGKSEDKSNIDAVVKLYEEILAGSKQRN